jgi:hypothetical protein
VSVPANTLLEKKRCIYLQEGLFLEEFMDVAVPAEVVTIDI